MQATHATIRGDPDRCRALNVVSLSAFPRRDYPGFPWLRCRNAAAGVLPRPMGAPWTPAGS